MIDVSVHRVERVELSRRYVSNGSSRTIRIIHSSGEAFEMTFYGNGAASLDLLPKAEYFREVEEQPKLEARR